MKKHLYLLLPLLTLNPTLATQKIITSTIIASTLALSHTTQQPSPNTQPPRNLHDLDEKHILNLILNNSLRKAKIKKHLPSELRGLIHTFFIHEWTVYGWHKDTGTTYDPHGFDINGIHKQTNTNLDFRGFTQNGDYKDVSPKTNKPTKYDPQGYNIDRWNKDGTHENGDKLNNQGFAQHVNHASIHLHKAIDNLDKRPLTLLLKNPNINVNLDNNGWTPLIWCIRCAWKGDDALDIAQALLKHQHINVNLQDNYGTTPLIMCSWKGDDALQIAQALLESRDINVNLQNNDGCTPLIMCCQEGKKSLPIAQELLSRKEINVNLPTKKGTTPLIMCCQTGDDALHIAQALLGHQHINVNLQDNYGTTPLIMCSWKGDDSLKIAQALLEHENINVNLQNNSGSTPLIICAYSGDKSLQIAQELLRHKDINVNLQNNSGSTPLIYCAWKGDDALEIAQALLKHQHININLQQKDAYTPLDIIIYCIKQNKQNYTYVQLWNILVAQGAILDKCKADYENLNPNNFQEPHKGYVQAIKNNPVMIISLKLSSLTQENERLRKQLEKLQKTSTHQQAKRPNTTLEQSTSYCQSTQRQATKNYRQPKEHDTT